jgi:hypothetical protein
LSFANVVFFFALDAKESRFLVRFGTPGRPCRASPVRLESALASVVADGPRELRRLETPCELVDALVLAPGLAATESCRPSTIASSALTRSITERRSGGSGRDLGLASSLRARSRCRMASQPRPRVFPVAERRAVRVLATLSAAGSHRSAASRLSRRWVLVNSALRSAGDADFFVGRGTARCGGVMATLLSLPHQSWPRAM